MTGEGKSLPEAEALSVVNRFGGEAIGALSPRLARRMILIERARNAFDARESSGDWVEWAEKNKTENSLLLWLVRCGIE